MWYFIAMIKDNLTQVKGHISSICKRLGRNPDDITLVGVTKYSTVDQIKEAITAGLSDIGENRVADALEKFKELYGLNVPIKRHLIGHLQSNKAAKAIENFDLIHSVDSLKLACELDKQAAKIDKKVQILVQVNISEEAQKFGTTTDAAKELVAQISKLRSIEIKGLMGMAPFVDDSEVVRPCFKQLKNLFDDVKKNNPDPEKVQMKYLSMGMSGDYEVALEEGSNMVRIGSAIFK